MNRPPDPHRRFAWATIAVAIAGGVLLSYFVVWSGDAVAELVEVNFGARAVHAGTAYQEKLTVALEGRRPDSAETWSQLDSPLEEAFRALPYLVGVVVRLPDGQPAAVIGNYKLADVPFVEPGGAGIRVVLGPGAPDHRRAVAAFVVPPTGVDRSQAAKVNVHLQFAAIVGLEDSFLRRLREGTIIVGLVIYMLAVLAFLVSRRGVLSAHRERERGVRLKAIGEVAGGIAHELRNPLNSVNLSVQLIERAMKEQVGEARMRTRDFERVYGEIGKIKKVVDNFVRFARLGDLTVTTFDLKEVVDTVLASFAPLLADMGIRLDWQHSGQTTMRGDREKIAQVVSATLQNAVDAMTGTTGGAITVRLQGKRSELWLAIRDTGEVLDEARLRSIFEPYYSARDHALGLGLTIAKTYVDCHGGVVDAASAQGGGCVVTITLPRSFV